MTVNVLALYADRSGCGDYRVRLPAKAVNERFDQFDVRVEVSDHFDGDAVLTPDGIRIRRIDIPDGVDVVSIQRPLKAQLAGAVMWLRNHRPDLGIAVDLDDDLANVPVSNSAYLGVHPKTSPEENYRWLRQGIALADVFTCSTPEIARIYGYDQSRTFVIRNAVPSAMLEHPSRAMSRTKKFPDDDRVVGWAGSVATHVGDLETTSGALGDVVGADVTDGRRVSFRNIGPPEGLAQALGLQERDVEASGWLTPDMYRVALGEIDVGIVPLADTRFNRAKSYLKAIEFAAAGVPVIASKTPEHEFLRDQGMPLWLVKPRRREWVRALRAILSYDNEELHEVAAQHRENVRRHHTIESRAEQWAYAWRQAAKIARQG